MSKPAPTRTHCKRSRPLPYSYPNCRTPRHWKFTQHEVVVEIVAVVAVVVSVVVEVD